MNLLLLPVHLYTDLPKGYTIYLLEEPKYFSRFRFNKNKLFYHRATMKEYASTHKLHYIDHESLKTWKPPAKCFMFDPHDYELEEKYKYATLLESPAFIASKADILQEYGAKKLNHVSFYRWQRRRLDILILNGKPEGGKWSFDTENRSKLTEKPPLITKLAENSFTKEARLYVARMWPNNPGEMNLTFPTSRKQALRWLRAFIDERLGKFGKFEDAISKSELLLFHSGLSPMMNVGLLTDKEVIHAVLLAAENKKNKIPLASLEGFIRQVIGWRNYMYAHYVINGRSLVKKNFFKHTGKIADDWWTGTGIEPIDCQIAKIRKFGYVHHIERLMILGSFLMMSGKSPHEVYRIFMEWTLDAYEWVMVPNIYGMSQFADGGVVMKRPYFSSSKYILRMGFPRGEWCDVWDKVFWNFVEKNAAFLKKTYFAALVNKIPK